MLRVFVALLLAACMANEPAPKIRFTYPGAIAGTQFDQDVIFAVGTPVAFDVEIRDTCERDGTKWGDKNDKTEYYDCHQSKVDVAVTCTGPCTVDAAQRVTATAPGAIHIKVEVTSRRTKRRYMRERSIFVVPANGFLLVSDGPHRCDPQSLDVGAPSLECRVRAGNPLIEFQLEEPVGPAARDPYLIDGQPLDSNRFSLAEYLQARGAIDDRGGIKLPTEPLRVELARGDYKKTLVFVFP